MAQETAVDFLLTSLPLGVLGILESRIKQAKEMDKQQKKYFFDCGRQFQITGIGTFTEVYDETYKK